LQVRVSVRLKKEHEVPPNAACKRTLRVRVRVPEGPQLAEQASNADQAVSWQLRALGLAVRTGLVKKASTGAPGESRLEPPRTKAILCPSS
jgi:hypothetical protein